MFDREQIIQSFIAESDENLATAELAIVELERNPTDQERLNMVFRAVHTLKGDAMALGFSWLGEFAHAMEDLLDEIREQRLTVTANLATLLLQATDALRQILADAVAGTEQVQIEHKILKGKLEAARSGAPRLDTAAAPAEAVLRDDTAQMERTQTLRVELSRVDRMLTLAGEIAVSRARLSQLLDDMAGRVPPEIREAHLETERLFLELQELTMKVRMVPVTPIFRQYARAVRDIAASRQKHVRLEIDVDGAELDTTLVEHLRGALTHMIRNAIDHGIETPEVRTKAGKEPGAVLRLSAHQEGGTIVIQVADDGSGLDRARIGQRAKALGLCDTPSALNDQELCDLIFEPGFSTAVEVTELSGRGIGLDVVRRNIDALRGSVSVHSVPGKGTTFSIQLPLTLAIIDGFVVGVGDDRYVIPLTNVVECGELPSPDTQQQRSQGVFALRGKPVPYLRLREHFKLSGSAPDRESVVVVKHSTGQIGLAVDALYGDAQTVIKPLGAMLRSTPGISGSAILGNGRVGLILDVAGLLRSAGAECLV